MNMKNIKNILMISLMLFVSIFITGTIICTRYNITPVILQIYNQEKLTGSTLVTGTYLSTDGHKIVKDTNGTLTYDDTYTLTAKTNVKGSTITGKVGTDSKSVTFYQLNSSTFYGKGTLQYTHNNQTEYMCYYTVFKAATTPTPVEDGLAELWRNNVKINTYATLQDAVDAASINDTVKITKDYSATAGVYINKNITLDGNNHTIDRRNLLYAFLLVEKDVTLNLKNITIDGGATGFEVDHSNINNNSYNIPIKNESATTDPKLSHAAVISKGNLVADNIQVNNNYVNGHGAGLQIAAGSATFTNSKFIHNRGNNGAAFYVYSTFEQDKKEYPIKNLSFDNCIFTNNYATSGAGVCASNIEAMSFKNCTFTSNYANNGYGGGIAVARNTIKVDGVQYNSQGHALGLDYTQATIDNCLFENNMAGRDGFAVQNCEAEFTITNTTFRGNIGINSSSSSGTFACHVFRNNSWATQIIKNCIFEENQGKVSCLGEYGSKIFVGLYNTSFIRNKGESAILYWTANTDIKDCTFIDDQSTDYVIGVSIESSSDYYEGDGNTGPNVNLSNTSFTGSTSSEDISVETAYDDETIPKVNVTLTGNTNANVSLSDDNSLTIEGVHQGNVTTDSTTSTSNVTVKETATLIGEVIKSNIVVNYHEHSSDTDYKNKSFYIEPDTKVTPEYIQNLLNIEEEGYILKIYTDEALTKEWDYTSKDNLTLYTNWVGHTHTKQTNLTVLQSGIYYSCECGYQYEGINMLPPTKIIYDGNPKEISITNTLNIKETDYKVTYKVKKNDDSWISITGSPIEPGEYKAELTYNGLTAELKYKIYNQIENPVTSSNNIELVFTMIILLLSFTIIYITQKNNNKIKVGN